MSGTLVLLQIVMGCTQPPPPPPAPLPEVVEAEPVEPPLRAIDTRPAAKSGDLQRQLQLIWQVILDEENNGPPLDSYGHLQQRVFRVLREDEALLAAVVDELPEDIGAHVTANVTAQRQARGTVRTASATVPAWRIVEPEPVEELLAYYREAEADSGTPWHLLAAVHLIETRMGRLQGVSVAGAEGPMQFMPATWDSYGEGEVTDNHDAIIAAGRYLAAMGAADDVDKALWAYNHSHRYVDSVRTWSELMQAQPLLYRAYHGWEVYYVTSRGAVWLAPGYAEESPVPVNDWCAKSNVCAD